MSRSYLRTVSLLLIGSAVLFISLTLLLQVFLLALSNKIIPSPPAQILDTHTDRPLQVLYQLEADAARKGWTPDRLRQAGDLWRSAGDLTRAVGYWEAIAKPDAGLLRDRAQADITLERWADAADTLDKLLTLLPPNTADRTWAQFQLGLIRLAYDPARALDLLRASQPAYNDPVAKLLPMVDGVTDPLQIGVALAKNNLWAYAELAFSQSGDPLASAYSGLARDIQGKDGADQIETALALAPDNPQVRFLQGLHLRLNYDYPGSLKAMIQAAALDPQNPALYAELGKAYQLTGDLPSAEHWLKFAVGLDAHFQPLLDAFYNDEKSALLSLGLVDEAALPFDATPEAGQ